MYKLFLVLLLGLTTTFAYAGHISLSFNGALGITVVSGEKINPVGLHILPAVSYSFGPFQLGTQIDAGGTVLSAGIFVNRYFKHEKERSGYWGASIDRVYAATDYYIGNGPMLGIHKGFEWLISEHHLFFNLQVGFKIGCLFGKEMWSGGGNNSINHKPKNCPIIYIPISIGLRKRV